MTYLTRQGSIFNISLFFLWQSYKLFSFLSFVDITQMTVHGPLASKTLGTLRTLPGFLASVNIHMVSKSLQVCETFFAYLTWILLFAIISVGVSFVSGQMSFQSCPRTLWADGLLMSFHVVLNKVRMSDNFITSWFSARDPVCTMSSFDVKLKSQRPKWCGTKWAKLFLSARPLQVLFLLLKKRLGFLSRANIQVVLSLALV